MKFAPSLVRVADDKLAIIGRENLELVKSVRNLPNAKFLPPEGVNVMDVLRYDTLLVTADAAKQIEERLTR